MSKDFAAVREFALSGGGRLFVAPTNARDLVIVEGSVRGGPNLVPRSERVLPALAAALLDAGTTSRSKNEIRDGLAARGISLEFGSSGDRTRFSGRCFPEDLPRLLNVMCECLNEASFPETEVKTAKALALGALADERSDTRAQAERAFAALLYDASHVNYRPSVPEEEHEVRAASRGKIRGFASTLGRTGLMIAVVGDVVAAPVHAAVTKAFARLDNRILAVPPKKMNRKQAQQQERHIELNDKANVDVLLGAALPVTITHVQYHALRVVAEMLGGGFTAHLMQTLRQRDGLTYGVYARLAGFDDGADGYLKVWASFSPARFAESVALLRKEVDLFFSKGLTELALVQTQERLVGSYLVSLSTTESLALALHCIGQQARELSYLSDFPDIIRAVTRADLHAAVALIPIDKLALVAAGTIGKS
ncbi:hypothetical protein COU19_01540 [Candidatus Kaiserbacteria bacterium CG10_big_fil_rev_8_21_14_0_10_56_12]|uniref:Insulinase family protein n=1 Tax=Candidatus Kaiserbacteria bacterium CG10_big_fil_rev_8_21_14_0_10_56_12 TaxID=1974611 RepID=A0A2H0UC65_9BACT|nr:MAG: hypothetical protein COU19_01540 [Candidatus Kaiserbacteria bacterium CG10_big_fil_rev_8_21_14_0_10_56_12]